MRDSRQSGSALVTTLMLLALLSALLVAHTLLTRVESATTKSSIDSSRGFYAAEAGLNLRAEEIRQRFLDYNRPTGVVPEPGSGGACFTGTQGSGDFECRNLFLEHHDVATHVTESAANPSLLVIPPGEQFENLFAQEYIYTVNAVSTNARDPRPEAILEMHFRSRLVPMFQFAAFYGKDLEISPNFRMELGGPVHTNGDLYLDTPNVLEIDGQVTAAGDLFRGRKSHDVCTTGTIAVYDPGSPEPLPACASVRSQISDVSAWNDQIKLGVEALQLPPPGALDPTTGNDFWDRADLRIVLDLSDGSISARDASGNQIGVGLCGAAGASNTFNNRREGTTIEMLEIDVQAMLNCVESNPLLMQGKLIDDATDGGLVWYFGVDGPIPDGSVNNYGVRLTNAAKLSATSGFAPDVRGMTVVTNQAIYLQGDFNSVAWRPAAVVADSLNILSNAWTDAWNDPTVTLETRVASPTTVNAALLTGTDTTGDVEGAAGQDLGDYNGGLENFPRLHEWWEGTRMIYRGSMVSLNEPRHVAGPWSAPNVYRPPVRDWAFDARFNDAAKLPPLTPRFVYLKQDLFVRSYGWSTAGGS